VTYQPRADEHGQLEIPTLPVDNRTLLFDVNSHQQVMWLEGVVNLPVGAVVELAYPNEDATVVGVRLLAGPTSALLCLDLDVPEQWWEERFNVIAPRKRGPGESMEVTDERVLREIDKWRHDRPGQQCTTMDLARQIGRVSEREMDAEDFAVAGHLRPKIIEAIKRLLESGQLQRVEVLSNEDYWVLP